ncbi:probable pectinesterase/pectinesterase inhibitor 59 [Syzygium oleosum]|uniref:probable pectinesterase/pectinesterase inhibitor 59 n=1 Tax=Syzygium oleosum TaxID=219896 RepID=UPI0011D2129C|nr:probable pectinesterase/pectinesterase inhibitor 59 [Syzygium oleosum]
MDMIVRVCLICILFFPSSAISRNNNNDDISRWCGDTPHPPPCNYFVGHRRRDRSPPQDRSEFRQIMIDVTMDRALDAQWHVSQFSKNCTTDRQRQVWSVCTKLYYNTVWQLNRTLEGLGGPHKNCSNFDAQTWLSTALTNIQACQLGFQDLNVSDFISPALSTNLSQLISNSLAVNGVLLQNEKQESYEEGFPSWLSSHDRKLLQSSTIKANLVVAKDGSGHFQTIQAALDEAAKRRSTTARFIIYVKKGVYGEYIEVANNNNNILMIGDGIKSTIITGSRSVGGGYTTYSSATAGIDGVGFIARGITFVNTAGPQKGQAVALRSASDLSVFYRCAFQGYQDTLWVLSQRQFYKSCYIFGTIDFIFGNAAVVFQNCLIYARKPLLGQSNVITAQGRNDPFQNTGISIHNSRVLATSDLLQSTNAVQTYLGRPWMQYSRTVYMKTYLGSLVSPAGWTTWAGSNSVWNTLYYGEYGNSGPGSSTRNRVTWPGYHVITSAATASSFTVGSFIAGGSWLPATGVPFTSGL